MTLLALSIQATVDKTPFIPARLLTTMKHNETTMKHNEGNKCFSKGIKFN